MSKNHYKIVFSKDPEKEYATIILKVSPSSRGTVSRLENGPLKGYERPDYFPLIMFKGNPSKTLILRYKRIL